MTQGFVWFPTSSDNPVDAGTFYKKLLGWRPSEGPGGMTMLAGESGPFAGATLKDSGPAGEFFVVRDPGGAAIALWQKA